MTMNKSRYIGWCAVVFLLIISIYCEFQMGNSWGNAFVNVVVTFGVFWLGYWDANKKIGLQQCQIDELRQLVEQLETKVFNTNNSGGANMPKPTDDIDWKHAIRR